MCFYVQQIYLFIYLGVYVAFNVVQVISRWVVLWTEETSTYSWSRFCTVNCRPTVSNYQLSHLRPCWEPNPGLRGGRRVRVFPLCHCGPLCTAERTFQCRVIPFYELTISNLLFDTVVFVGPLFYSSSIIQKVFKHGWMIEVLLHVLCTPMYVRQNYCFEGIGELLQLCCSNFAKKKKKKKFKMPRQSDTSVSP